MPKWHFVKSKPEILLPPVKKKDGLKMSRRLKVIFAVVSCSQWLRILRFLARRILWPDQEDFLERAPNVEAKMVRTLIEEALASDLRCLGTSTTFFTWLAGGVQAHRVQGRWRGPVSLCILTLRDLWQIPGDWLSGRQVGEWQSLRPRRAVLDHYGDLQRHISSIP